MFVVHKKISITAICFVMLSILITGCHQQEKNVLPACKEPVREEVEPNSQPKESITGTNEVKQNGDTSEEQKQKTAEVSYAFYPSGPDFIKSVINERGNVEITDDMREKFNLFARDYRWCYMPDMNYYESFFDANEYTQSLGYNNFGFAVFYVLNYMKCPEKISDNDMQNAIQSLFVAKQGYKDMPHQAYRKLADYEDGYYSPWPEGGLDHNRMFYLLTKLEIVQHGADGVYITVCAKNYYFNDSGYEPGENEKWLIEKSNKMGMPDMQAAAKLVKNGEMKELKGDSNFETTIYIKFNGQKADSYNPRFVFNNTCGNDPNEI
ncbi:MAG: hypothetical protein GXY49_09875 [Syntrophomonadaceae bacterium]|jgi:hypothetical protein|nr:hypothetical protein [Syntrophomonadaceae bacterium]